jgi:hypothetical protein
MNVLNDTMEIVEPSFDRPETTETLATPISVGTRVSLLYHGSRFSVQVEAIERLGTSFVGRVWDVAKNRTCRDDLPLVRFRPRDVAWID